ncbi:MAG: hypothetical protein HFJ06_01715 [Lachnospiraceae bacterium]|nr:hypothetical protein [Lachnospiraceae bacterium]
MNMETYEAHYNKERIYKELEISENQIKEGCVLDAKEALNVLREKYTL